MSLRIAGLGKQIDLTDAQIVGFAALAGVRIVAVAGGSAISRVFIEIANAVASGTDQLPIFAAIAGQSAELRTAFEQDCRRRPFIEGLGQLEGAGQSVFEVLDALGLGKVRVRDALLQTPNASDRFRGTWSYAPTVVRVRILDAGVIRVHGSWGIRDSAREALLLGSNRQAPPCRQG